MTSAVKKTVGIGVAILVLVVCGIVHMKARNAAYAKAREISQQNICRNNLRMIDDAKDQAALTNNYGMDDAVSEDEISPYLKYGFPSLVCPKGGHYTINAVGREAECSEHGSMSSNKVSPPPAAASRRQSAADARSAAMEEAAVREAMRVDGVMAAQTAARRAKLAAEAEAVRLEQERQVKIAAEVDAARVEQERQARLAAEAEAARLTPSVAPSPVVPVEEPPPVDLSAEYKLSGIMGGKGGYMAIINGKMCDAGDMLGTARILKIDATQVTVGLEDGTTTKLRVGASPVGRATPRPASRVPPRDAPVLPPGLRKGLLAYYPFNRNESGRVSDLSDSLRHATAENVTWTPDGKVGGAVRFTPKGSRISASDDGLPVGDSPRSIALWKKTGPNNEICLSMLTYGEQSRGRQCSLGMDWRNGRSSVAVSPSGTCNVARKKLENERWDHIVYCYGGDGEHSFYINGVLDSLAVREFRTFSTQLAGKLLLGDSDEKAPSFDGFMDEVMIYDRVLSPAEVRQIYERK